MFTVSEPWESIKITGLHYFTPTLPSWPSLIENIFSTGCKTKHTASANILAQQNKKRGTNPLRYNVMMKWGATALSRGQNL